jgi:hypothetical protein
MSIPLDMGRFDNASIGLLATTSDATGAKLTGYVIADSDGPMPKLVAGRSVSLGMVDQVTGLFLPEPPDDIDYAASVRSSPNSFDVVYGRASIPGRTVLASNPGAPASTPMAILRVANSIQIFFGQPGAPTGSSIVSIADGMMPSAPRSLGSPAFALLSAGTNPMGKLNVAFAEIGPTIGLRVGQIDAAQLGSFTAADTVEAKQYGGLAEVPYTTRPRWFGDSLVAVGPTSIKGNELSIAWGEVNAHVVQVQKVLLTAQRGGKVRTAAWAAEQQLGPLGGFIDLFWIETYQDDAGMAYDVLYYDQVRCI